MSEPLSILLVGESWFTYSIHQKGFDAFQTAEYTEGGEPFIKAVEAFGHRVRHIPGHLVDADFPTQASGLVGTDVVVLSDVGANTFLLGKATFGRSEVMPNRLEMLAAWVRGGGALLMIGGYLSFSGIDGKARYGRSPLADVLPVAMADHDDRVELPEGCVPEVVVPGHPALAGVAPDWPPVLGYNKVTAKPDASVLVARGADPILVAGTHGDGRSAAFTPDLAPHWAPPEFVAWDSYGQLWRSLLTWLARRS